MERRIHFRPHATRGLLIGLGIFAAIGSAIMALATSLDASLDRVYGGVARPLWWTPFWMILPWIGAGLATLVPARTRWQLLAGVVLVFVVVRAYGFFTQPG